jgi:hypothetical protein
LNEYFHLNPGLKNTEVNSSEQRAGGREPPQIDSAAFSEGKRSDEHQYALPMQQVSLV